MSHLQGGAKEVLTALILGEGRELDRVAMLAITKWTVMFAMVAECTDPEFQAIPSSQLKSFSETREVPMAGASH